MRPGEMFRFKPYRAATDMATREDLLDQLAMLSMGNQGNTISHMFLEDLARGKPNDMAMMKIMSRSFMTSAQPRFFIPPKDQDRVIMFSDKSGVYVHSDMFCTPMGSDISGEVGAWAEEQ